MKHGLLLSIFALVLLSCAEPGQPRRAFVAPSQSDNLAAVIADIQTADARARDGDVTGIMALPHNVDVLTRAIDSGEVQGDAMATLRYYRGLGRQLLVRLNESLKLPFDREMAEGALADFLAVAEAAGDDSSRVPMKANAIFSAAQVTAGVLGDRPKGYEYFRQCAAMKQAGCQNVMAVAMLTGTEGIPRDINGALAMHKEVYDTGIGYTCAGSYSARSIAFIVHFTDASLDDRSGLDWLRRASGLADQVKARAGGLDVCNTLSYRIDEYLMRLEAGQREDELLSPLQGSDSPLRPVVLDYLLGKASDTAYTAELGKMDAPSRCGYAFLGLWKSSIDGNAGAARSYRSILAEKPDELACASNLVYAERLMR